MNALAADNKEPAVDIPEAPTFREAARLWAKIGLLSFGGPAGQIALMHKELVEERRWIGEQRFLHALNYCMLLPGPEANSSPSIGWAAPDRRRPRCRHPVRTARCACHAGPQRLLCALQ